MAPAPSIPPTKKALPLPVSTDPGKAATADGLASGTLQPLGKRARPSRLTHLTLRASSLPLERHQKWTRWLRPVGLLLSWGLTVIAIIEAHDALGHARGPGLRNLI